jgi:adhesin transport system outer membrane protein
VFTGGQLSAELEIAQVRQRMAALEIEVTGRELALQLLDLYRTWWFHNRRAEVLEWSLRRMDDVRQMMRRRSTSGVSAALDLAQAELQWQRTSDEQRQALRLRDQALGDMGVMLGQAVTPRFDPLTAWPALPFANLLLLQDHVLASHPSIQLAEGSVAQAQAELRRVRAAIWPNVSVRVERQYGSYYGALDAGNRVYLSTQLSTGAGLSTLNLQTQAALRAQTAEAQGQAQRVSLQAQAQKIWNDHQLGLQQLDLVTQQLKVQESLADAGVRLFAGGRRSWQDLLTLQREVFQLQAQVAELESAVLGARVRLLLLADVLPQFSQASY